MGGPLVELYVTNMIASGAVYKYPGSDHDDGSNESQAGVPGYGRHSRHNGGKTG